MVFFFFFLPSKKLLCSSTFTQYSSFFLSFTTQERRNPFSPFPPNDMAIVPSSSSDVINNEVFISFRGDTRKNFTSHLYSVLCRKGIRTYRDDPNLERGDEISPALSRAIEESMISIVVFSKEYASSRWCLDELVHILRCKNERRQIVLPVFYDIDPSDIRKQKGTYAIAFDAHKERFEPKKVEEWRNALTAAADLSGFHSQDQYESELIEKIVKDVLRKLKRLPQISIDTKGLVGIEQQLKEIESLLCFGLPNPRVIGLWGLGGIGKTTLAIEIFNRFSYQFENFCFLENVRENSEKHGLSYLETKLFSNLLEERDLESPVNSFVRNRVHKKTMLIVLDDVDNIRQLDCLLGDGSWFGPGSKVIITTRDAQLLKKVADESTHQVEPLDFDEALELFYLNSFKTKPSITRFIELSEAIVTYTGGNPLALKILGSSLHSQAVEYWEHTWNKLKIIPHSDIQKVLKISYDGLDDTERDIFLDIACFLKGERRDFIESILDNCGLFPSLGIEVLINKSLITIFGGKVRMHDLIQEMGWEIVRQQSIKDPGERSRLWIPEEVHNVLEKNSGTGAIEGIYLDMSKIDDDLHLKPTVLNKMQRLRLLKIYNHSYDHKFKVYLTQGLQFLPPSLRYLHWYSYPIKSLPSDYKGKNLVELHMPRSELKQLWSGVQNLGNLKRINLGYSKQLIKFPDQSLAPKLESINLEGCTNLVEVPPLNFQGCFGFLTLHGCIKIKSLPKILGNIKYLNLDETGIKELPLSIGHLESLVQLSLRGCQHIKNLSAASFPRNLQDLNLSDLSIKQVPSSIGSLDNLVQLSLRGCQHIKYLPATLPRNLERLYLIDSSIEQVSSSSIEGLDCLKIFNLSRCKKLESLPTNIFKCKSLQFLDLGDCSRFKKLTGIQVLSNSVIIEKFFGLRRQDMSWRKKLEFVPKWIYYLSCLKFLSRHGYLEPEHLQVKQFSLFSFNQLDLRNCNIVEIPVWLSLLSPLTILNLSGNPFENIPSSIIQLHRLNTLYIYGCKKLRSLPQLPSSVRDLNASGCTSLETISSSECYGFNIRHVIRPFISNHKRFTFQNCWKLRWNECRILTDFLYGVDKLNLEGRRHTIEVCYPGNEIPKWFGHQGEGASTTMKLPHGWHNSNLMGFAICIVAPIIPAGAGTISFDLHLKTKCGQIHKYLNNYSNFPMYHYDKEEEAKITSSSDHVFARYIPIFSFNEHPDAMEASFYFKSQNRICDSIVKRIGVGLIYARVIEEEESTAIWNDSAIIYRES